MWMASRLRASVVWANTSTSSIRHPRSGAARSPATAARRRGTGWRRTSMSDPATRSDGAAPARIAVRKSCSCTSAGPSPLGERKVLVVTDHKGGFLANPALASRKDARDAVAAARKALAGWSGTPPTTAARCSPGLLNCSRAAGPSSPPRCARPRGSAPGRGGCRRRGHGSLGLVRRVGGQAGPGARGGQPGGQVVLPVLAARADRRGGGDRAAASSLLGFMSLSPPQW